MRIKLAILVGILAGMFLGFGLAGTASAHTPVIPGGQCSHAGAHGTHGSDEYVCQQKWTDECPVWHHVPQPGAGPRWTPKPCDCTPSAGPSASTTPVASPSPTVASSPTTPIVAPTPVHSTAIAVVPAGSLPVTGPPVLVIVGIGLLALVVGGTVVLISYLRRTARP